jgi:hypothetical protein
MAETTKTPKRSFVNKQQLKAYLQSIREEVEKENLHKDINKVYKQWQYSTLDEQQTINERIFYMEYTNSPMVYPYEGSFSGLISARDERRIDLI